MKINREILLSTLNKLKPAITDNSRTPEMDHVWFDKNSAMAYDGGLGIRLDFETDFDFGVTGQQLIKLLGTSPLKEAELEIEEAALVVKLGRSRSKLGTLSSERSLWHFPETAPRSAPRVKLSAGDVEALQTALIVKANPAVRTEHHGIILRPRKKEVVAYSTDSATILSVVLPEATLDIEADQVLVPRALVEQICKLCPDGANVVFMEDCIYASADGVRVYTNLLDDEGVRDMEKVMHKFVRDHPDAIPIPAGVAAAVERAIILAHGAEAHVDLTVAGKEGKEMDMTGSYGAGSAELDEIFDLDDGHPKGTIRINVEHLQRALPYAQRMSFTEDSLLLLSDDGNFQLLAAAAATND